MDKKTIYIEESPLWNVYTYSVSKGLSFHLSNQKEYYGVHKSPFLNYT
jgi:hypothetical protein